MKLQLFASAALVLLTAANGALSEVPSSIRGGVKGVLKAVADEVAEAEPASKDYEDAEDEQMEDAGIYDDYFGYKHGYTHDPNRYDPRRKCYPYCTDSAEADAEELEVPSSYDDNNKDMPESSSGEVEDPDDEDAEDEQMEDVDQYRRPYHGRSTYRRGYVDHYGNRKAYGYGNCWPHCADSAEADAEDAELEDVDQYRRGRYRRGRYRRGHSYRRSRYGYKPKCYPYCAHSAEEEDFAVAAE